MLGRAWVRGYWIACGKVGVDSIPFPEFAVYHDPFFDLFPNPFRVLVLSIRQSSAQLFTQEIKWYEFHTKIGTFHTGHTKSKPNIRSMVNRLSFCKHRRPKLLHADRAN